MDYTLIGWIISIALIILGFLGNILPLLPGGPLLLAGFVLGASINDFERVGWWTLLVLGILTVALQVVDFLAGAWGAKKVGASKHAIIGAMLGSIIGIFFSLPGLILGPFIGAFAGEFIAQPNALRASGVGFATWLGIVLGTVAKLVLSLVMISIFLTVYLASKA